MSSPLLKVSLGVGTVVGLGGLGTVSTYEATKKTINNGLKRKIISVKDGESDGAWIKLMATLKGYNKPSPLSKELISVYDETIKNPTTSIELKKWCEKIGSQVYYTIFNKNESLLIDVNNFCTISIKDFMESSNLLELDKDETNLALMKPSFSQKLESLKSYQQDQGNNKELVKELKDIQLESKKANSPEDLWKTLAHWCSSSFEKGFFSSKDPVWLQTNLFCKK